LRTLISLLIPTVILFAVLIALGTWQLQRKAWKEELIATLTERLAAPGALPARATWPALNRNDTEYRRVAFTATFDDAKEALVYAAASAFRPDVSGPGYWVFTPARLADGGVVMVNRGFVPPDLANPAARPGGHASGPIQITGTLRWPDARSWFSPGDDPAHNLWFLRDPASIAAAKGAASRRALLCGAGSAGAAGRLAAAGQTRGAAAQRAPAIRGHLVWTGTGSGGRFCGLGAFVLPQRRPTGSGPSGRTDDGLRQRVRNP
jgi:surfeit locus 1 family protein